MSSVLQIPISPLAISNVMGKHSAPRVQSAKTFTEQWPRMRIVFVGIRKCPRIHYPRALQLGVAQSHPTTLRMEISHSSALPTSKLILGAPHFQGCAHLCPRVTIPKEYFQTSGHVVAVVRGGLRVRQKHRTALLRSTHAWQLQCARHLCLHWVLVAA